MVTSHLKGVKKQGPTKAKHSAWIREESGVSLEHLPRSFLKTRNGTRFERSLDVLVVSWMQDTEAHTVFGGLILKKKKKPL